MTITTGNTETAQNPPDTDNVLGYDNSEEYQEPNDLAVLIDEDGREGSLSEEQNIPLYQKPLVKIGVLTLLIGGTASLLGFLYVASQVKVNQIAKEPDKPDNVGGLTFDSAQNSDKAAIALNGQRGQFSPPPADSSTSSSPSPSASSPPVVVAPPAPSPTATPPSVVVSPAPRVVVTPPSSTAQENIKPKPIVHRRNSAKPRPLGVSAAPTVIAATPRISRTPQSITAPVVTAPTPKISIRSKPMATPIVTATTPKISTRTQPITTPIAAIPAPRVSIKPTAAGTPTVITDTPKIATRPTPLSQPIAPVIATAPKDLFIAAPTVTTASSTPPIAATPQLSPKEQWLAMSRAGAFGNATTGSTENQGQPDQPTESVSPTSVPMSSTPSTLATIAQVNNSVGSASDPDPVVDLRQPPVGDLIAQAPEPSALASPTPEGTPVTATPSVRVSPMPIPSIATSEPENPLLKTDGKGKLAAQPTLVAHNGDPRRFKIDLGQEQPQNNEEPLSSEQAAVEGVSADRSYQVPVGTKMEATVLTPVQASSVDASGISPVGNLVAVRLDAPLKDSAGRVILPSENTQVIFRFQVKNGWVVATSETLIVNGQKTNIQGLLTMQGAGGQPLIAKSYKPGADELAAADRNLLLWGAVQGAGDAATQSDSTVTVGNGSTIVQNSGNRNILGGILKGAGTPIVQAQQERARTQVAAAQAREPIYFVTPGERVYLYSMGQMTVNN
jgi:hypothetical protein